jgi:phage-related protein
MSENWLQELKYRLAQVADRSSSGQDLVDWSDERHWDLLEGSEADDETAEADFLREILYDITMQWECLVANVHSTAVEFPDSFIQEWLSEVQEYMDKSYSIKAG